MAYIPSFIQGKFWGPNSPTIDGVRYIAGIKNTGSVAYTIDNVYVQNTINNPQELNNITNFAFTVPDNLVSYSLLTSGNLIGKTDEDKYKIPYPPNYRIIPGNVPYAGFGLTEDIYNWRFKNTFDLQGGETLYFVIQFTPGDRKQDFYRADLVLKYHVTGTNNYGTQTFNLRGDFVYEVDKIDTKDFPEQVMVVNGVPFGGLITIQ